MGNTKIYMWEGRRRQAEVDAAALRRAFASSSLDGPVALSSVEKDTQTGTIQSDSMNADDGVAYLRELYEELVVVRVDLDWPDVVVATWHHGELVQERHYVPSGRAFWGS